MGDDNADPQKAVGKTNPRVATKPQSAPVAAKATTYGKHATMPVLASDNYAAVILPDITEFQPSAIKLDATIVAVGKRRTGKSWVFRNLMYLMKDQFEAGIVISQTDELNKFWQQYIPSKYIYPKYEPEILDAVFTRQKKILNDKNLSDEEKEKKAPFFILLDDVISDQRPQPSQCQPSPQWLTFQERSTRYGVQLSNWQRAIWAFISMIWDSRGLTSIT